MAVTLKQLQGENIPEHLRHISQDIVFQVIGDDGQNYAFSSEEEAAARVVMLSEQEKKGG
jgi:hypothetical protein